MRWSLIALTAIFLLLPQSATTQYSQAFIDLRQKVFTQCDELALHHVAPSISKVEQHWLLAYDAYLKIITGRCSVSRDTFLRYSAEFRSASAKSKDKDIQLLSSENHLQTAVINMLSGENLAAFFALRRAQSSSAAALRVDPDNHLARRTQAIIAIACGQLPSGLRRLVEALTPLEGDYDRGCAELKKLSTEEHWSIGESLLHALVLLPPHDHEDILQRQKEYSRDGQCHYTLALFQADVLLKQKNTAECQSVLMSLPTELHRGRWHYYMARAALLQLNYGSAAEQLDSFLRARPDLFHNDALLKRKWCSVLDSSMAPGKNYRWDMHPIADADIVALEDLMQGKEEHPGILGARLTMDAGHLAEARSMIEGIDTSILSPAHSEEWKYRTARIYHEDDQLDRAQQLYEKVLADHPGSERYYKTAALIYLAEIYISKGKGNKALACLHAAKQTRPKRYKRSLHHKADRLITEIQKD